MERWTFIFFFFKIYHGFRKITKGIFSMQDTHKFCHLSIYRFNTMKVSSETHFFLSYTSQNSNAMIWFHKGICSDMISNFLNPILFRICIEKFNHQMHILIRISAQKLPRRRLEGGGATVFYVVVQRVRSRIGYQIGHSTKLQLWPLFEKDT